MRGISFEGNHAIDDFTLSISIATSESSWWQRTGLVKWLGIGDKRYFDETEFRRDVLRLVLLYRQSGFFEARVDTVVRRGTDDVRVRFIITEGEPVRVTSVIVQGAESVLPSRELVADLPLQTGDPFSRLQLQASADTIRSLLQNRGYPFAEVFRNYDENRTGHVASVRFVVDRGPRVRLGGVIVEDGGTIDPGVVRRSAGLASGDLYRKSALEQSQIDLYRTDLFTHVSVGLVDSLTPPPAGDSTVDVRIEVSEGRLYQARAGAGFGAQDCFRGLAGATARNFAGGGRSLDVTGRVSKIGTGGRLGCLASETDTARLRLNYNVTATLRQPAFLNHRTSAALSVFTERRSELNTYVRQASGAEVSVAQEVAWQTSLTVSYGLSLGRTRAEPAIFCTLQNLCRSQDTLFSRARRTSTLGVSLFWDGSNSPLDPSRGATASLQGRYSSPLIGADTLSQFAKAIGDFASYHRAGRRAVFAWRVRAGGIIPAELGFSARTAPFVPPDERLYGGGPNTVRGYAQNELGPIVRVIDSAAAVTARADLTGDSIRTAATGGNWLIVLNAELRTVLPGFAGRLSGAVFADAGQVFNSDQPAAEKRLRITPGVGLRLATPLGPIRLDLAWRPYPPTAGPLYRSASGDLQLVQASYAPPEPLTSGGRFWSHVRLNFSVGQAF